MPMLVLWAVLLLVAVGLPLLALQLDRKAAARPSVQDAWAVNRRLGLSAADVEEVDRCLRKGLRAPEPRLRAAVVERARRELRQWQFVWLRRHRRAALLILIPLTACLGLLLVLSPSEDPFLFVYAPIWVLQLAALTVRRRRVSRALTLNDASDPDLERSA